MANSMEPIESKDEVIEHGAAPFGFVTKSGNFMSSDDITSQAASGRRSKQLMEEDSFVDRYGLHGLVEPPYPPESLINLLDINTYHFRACQTKASDAAGSGWHVRPKKLDSSKKNKDKVSDFFHSLQTPILSTLRDVLFDYEAIGWGAIEVIREDDESDAPVIDLKHIPAHTIRVHRQKMKYAQIRGAKTVWFKDISSLKDVVYNGTDGGTEVERGSISGKKRANELIFFKQYTQSSDFYGKPQVISALGAMLGDFEREEYNTQFFSNQGVPAYAVFITGDYDPGPKDASNRTELERVIERHLSELSGNPHATLLLTVPSARRRDGSPGNVNVVFQKLSEEVKEASFEKYRVANRNEVLAAHGIPVYRLGIAEVGALGQNTSTASDEIYKRSRIDPVQDMVETELNKWIVEEELDVEDHDWQLDELDTKDEEHDILIAVQLFNIGMLTPNQGIKHFGKKFGIEPDTTVKELDYHYIGGAAIELGLSKNPESDQGRRPADEETAGLASRGSREGENSASNNLRAFLESAEMPDEVREQLSAIVQSERG